MITVYLITFLFIVCSILCLCKPLRTLIEQKSIYPKCFKVPRTGFTPFFGHLLALNGRISKRGTPHVARCSCLFRIDLCSEHFQALLSFCREYPEEPVICIWFFLWPALVFHRVKYLEVFTSLSRRQRIEFIVR